jgi:predicted dehydrogenase
MVGLVTYREQTQRRERVFTMMDRALVVGLGSIGLRHLRLLRARLPEAKIMVLRYGSCKAPVDGADFCTTSLDEAIAFAPKVAIIANPAPFHCTTAIALAEAGTHLLVEKPMAVTASQARALTEVAHAAAVVLQVGYNLRFLESLVAFREALAGGRIGRVTSVRVDAGQYLPDWRPGCDWRETVSARSDLGGGVLLELSHELDYLRWLFGDVSEVRGWMGQQGGLNVEVEDTVHMILKFCAPTPVNSIGVAPVATVSVDFIRRDTVRRCVALGEDGTLIWDGIASEVRMKRPDAAETLLFETRPDRDASYLAQMDAFLDSVQSGAAVTVSANDGVAVMDLVEAVRRSHAAGGVMVTPGRTDQEASARKCL